MMNYPYPMAVSPYIQAAMSQAVQAYMTGAPCPQNCAFMPMQLPQLVPPTSYYGPSPYTNPPIPSRPQNYNYPIVPYTQPSKKKSPRQRHSNVYNSTSFDSYMENLSWSRLFHRSSRKNVKPQTQQKTQTEAKQTQKKLRSDSSSSSSSSTSSSDETIRRVDVVNNQLSTNGNSKQQTKSSLPFKYSSEFVPGLNGQSQQIHSQKIKSNDVFIIKKP